MNERTQFRSGYGATMARYLAVKETLGRQYTTERAVFTRLDGLHSVVTTTAQDTVLQVCVTAVDPPHDVMPIIGERSTHRTPGNRHRRSQATRARCMTTKGEIGSRSKISSQTYRRSMMVCSLPSQIVERAKSMKFRSSARKLAPAAADSGAWLVRARSVHASAWPR